MVDRDVVAGRLLRLTQALQDIETEFPGDARALATSPVVRAAIERWLQVAIEVCIDVAYHVIADRGWVPPDRAADAFDLLAARGMLDADLASRFGSAVGLRNVLVHEYVKVDLERLVRVIRDGLGDLRAFAAGAADWLEES